MDWQECCNKRIVKEASKDSNKISSIQEIVEEKYKAAIHMEDEYYYAKIPLLYDILRELLECIALEQGFKIYNPECYVAFLKEIIHQSSLGDEFNTFRLLRNGINYYGKKITPPEAVETIKQMIEFIKVIKGLLYKEEK